MDPRLKNYTTEQLLAEIRSREANPTWFIRELVAEGFDLDTEGFDNATAWMDDASQNYNDDGEHY